MGINFYGATQVVGSLKEWERNMRILFKVVWMLLGGVALSGAISHGFHAEENLALISSSLYGKIG